MKGKFSPIILAIIVISTSILNASAYTTKLNITPSRLRVLANQTTTINITVASVTRLNAWQVMLTFNPRVLTLTSFTIPSDSIYGARPYFFPTPQIDNTQGKVRAFCGLDGVGTNVNGSGRLATMIFTTKTIGVSGLNFVNVMKQQIDGTYLQNPDEYGMISFDANSGIIEVIGSGFNQNNFGVIIGSSTYNVAVITNSTVSSFYYSASTKEIGFNMTGAVGSKGASIVEIDKHILNGTLLTLMNNIGLRLFSRNFGTVPENATHLFLYFNFTYATGIRFFRTRLTVDGDITGDRRTDIADVARVSAAFGSYPGRVNWNPVTDVDQDLKTDISDLARVSANFGEFMPP